MMKLLRRKWFIPLIMFICITVILSIGGASFAKYYNEKSNQQTSGVAKFVIDDKIYNSVNNQYEKEAEFMTTENLKPGDVLKYRLEVENKSEVKISYIIDITSTSNLPLYVNDEKLTSVAITISEEINAGESGEIIIEIVWPEEFSSTSYCGKIDIIYFTFIAEQKL